MSARRGRVLAAAYLFACTIAAGIEVIPSHRNDVALAVLVVLTLPLSPVTYVGLYVAVLATFGPSDTGPLVKAIAMTAWVGTAAFQVWIVSEIRRARRGRLGGKSTERSESSETDQQP